MDFESLKSTVSNLTLYDIKAGVRKVQNAVMNYTEMEAKVREATNNEPWGASSSLMQEIANGTFNYQQLNEIMPMIYKRFTEKAAEEWRQIYKALQLLEFLIKNGSERVIDDARSHLSLLKMLRQFHFIDQNGKDQGINVRNRSKELVDLLSDVEKIRAERKKARANRNKYGGYEGGSMGMHSSGMGMGMGMGGSSRYGGFGSDSAGYGGYSGGVYGDGGGFGGNEAEFDSTQSRRERFEEYNEYDEGEVAPPGRRKADEPSSPRIKRETKNAEAAKAKEPEVDLFSFDESAPAASASNGKGPATSAFGDLQSSTAADDDDFDDFQSAAPAPAAQTSAPSSFSIPPPASTSTTTSATQFAQPKPVSAAQGQSLNDIFSIVSPTPGTSATSSIPVLSNSTPSATTTSTPSAALKSPPILQNYQPSQPNYYTSVAAQPTQAAGSGASTPSSTFANLGKPAANPLASSAKKPAGGADPFANLLGGMGSSKQAQGGAKMADMAKQKSSAGLWGPPASSGSSTPAPQLTSQQPQQKIGGGLDDLLG